uniref:B30.2/SPRY domain-containing protein n=1 Tax=Cyprinodon variegatus TaxID=28743 RepID=A0A3Q2DYX6_CYPVA
MQVGSPHPPKSKSFWTLLTSEVVFPVQVRGSAINLVLLTTSTLGLFFLKSKIISLVFSMFRIRAVTQLKDTLWEEMKKQLELKRVQQYAVDLTLDPDTAHPKLILSDDGKQVKHGDVWQDLPDNKERFSDCVDVLACQSFSSGSFYFEVQVKGKTDWDLGVAKDSINRKGFIDLSIKNGFWTIVLRNGNQYLSGDNSSDHVYLPTVPERVGVFVDYEKGLVSFYDVDTAALIYSFSNCCFTEKLKPYFSPYLNKGGTNSAPLIICTVNQARCCCYEAS